MRADAENQVSCVRPFVILRQRPFSVRPLGDMPLTVHPV